MAISLITCICGQYLLQVKVTQVDHALNGVQATSYSTYPESKLQFQPTKETLYYAPSLAPFSACPFVPGMVLPHLSRVLWGLSFRPLHGSALSFLFWAIHQEPFSDYPYVPCMLLSHPPFLSYSESASKWGPGDIHSKYHCLLDIEKSLGYECKSRLNLFDLNISILDFKQEK